MNLKLELETGYVYKTIVNCDGVLERFNVVYMRRDNIHFHKDNLSPAEVAQILQFYLEWRSRN